MPPTGKLATEPRKFKKIVADMRHVVFSVVRDRPNPTTGKVDSAALGTGFFVKADVFITCHHVINPQQDPHRPGDSYRLIANMGASATVHTITNPQLGKELTFFPDLDIDVMQIDVGPDHPYAAISYDEVVIGEEIGVVGYPLAALKTDPNGNLLLEGLIYRAARGAVTGRYEGTFAPAAKDLPLVEVNFMFVSGNSGGPLFEAENGRVVGMVQGINWYRIFEQVVPTGLKQLPLGLVQNYIMSIHAIYSRAIKLDCFRPTLESFGVTP